MSDVLSDGSIGVDDAAAGVADSSTPVATGAAAVDVPKPIEVGDDTLISFKGAKSPVKFGEHTRNLQSQWTKASQRAAQLERDLQAERQARTQLEAAQRDAASRQQAGSQPDVYSQLRALPYLSGEDAVHVVQSIGEQFRYRDQLLMATLQQIQGLKQVVSQLNDAHVGSSFDAKISRWLKDGGYPDDPAVADLAKEIYLAYTGDDLDEEFPRIFQERWDAIQRVNEAQRQARITAARRQPFVPGKGGAAGPSKFQALDPKFSHKQTADALWDAIQTGEGT